MIRFDQATLSLNRYELSPSTKTRGMVPTVLSPLSYEWGAESCADNLDPATLTAEVIIPRTHAHLYPTLQTLVSLALTVSDGAGEFLGGGPVFRGRVESVNYYDQENRGDILNLVPAAGWTFLYGTDRAGATALPVQQTGRRMNVTVPVPPGAGTHHLWAVSPIMTATPDAMYQLGSYTQDVFDVPWDVAVTVEELDAGGAVTGSWELYDKRLTTTDNQTDKWYLRHFGDVMWPGAQRFRLVFHASVRPVSGAGVRIVGLDMTQAVDVTGWDEREFRPALRRYKISVADASGAAGRIRVGSEPWPAESGGNRAFRIAQAAQDRGSLLSFTGPAIYQLLAPRDVDSQSALDCIQRVYASTGEVSTGSATAYDMVTPAKLPLYVDRLAVNPATGKAQIVAGRVYDLPAGCIQRSDISLDSNDLTNQYRLGWRDTTAQEDAAIDFVNTASVNQFGPMSRTSDTDLPAPEGPAAERARAITALQGSPRPRLSQDAVVVLKAMPAQNGIDALLDSVTGFAAVVRIPDPPDGIGNLHRVHGLKPVFGKSPSLTLKLEPYESTWARAVMFSEVQADPELSSLTFAKSDTVTFSQVRTASPKGR